jgi:aspartyl-tRNA(Asn)/glutamyl-tRNA(Gln) amidotransferase subunit A
MAAMSDDLYALTAAELSSAYGSKSVSPVDVVRAALQRIESCEPSLNAMYILDADGALEQAQASEARWMAGEPLSVLDGVPITIKENQATKGDPSPLGTRATELVPAAADSPPAARVREAGCVILGKTTMPDFGMLASGVSSFHGTTRNPWNTSRNTFGSSSGAAAGLAAGYAPLAIGTDIGGSVRLPGAATGTFAHKPSLGRIPIHPPFLGRVAGPMTRTVADAAALLNVLAQPDARDYMALEPSSRDWSALSASVDGKRMALCLHTGMGMDVQPAVITAIENAAKLLESIGAGVEPIDPFLDEEIFTGLDAFFAARLLADVQALPPERVETALPFIVEWCRRAEAWSAADALRALNKVMLMREKTHAALQGFDFLISPTSPLTAYDAGLPAPGNDPARALPHVGFTAPFNFSEQPAASVPCGFDDDGLPIGLQIAGHRFDDAGVLNAAAAYEAASGLSVRPTEVRNPE